MGQGNACIRGELLRNTEAVFSCRSDVGGNDVVYRNATQIKTIKEDGLVLIYPD